MVFWISTIKKKEFTMGKCDTISGMYAARSIRKIIIRFVFWEKMLFRERMDFI